MISDRAEIKATDSFFSFEGVGEVAFCLLAEGSPKIMETGAKPFFSDKSFGTSRTNSVLGKRLLITLDCTVRAEHQIKIWGFDTVYRHELFSSPQKEARRTIV